MILGGGYTGMWTAFHLKQLDPGTDVVILEQDICGGGPSGRNGGFVNSYWGDLPRLVSEFGDKAALSLCEAGEESVHAIGAFCDEHGIDAWFRHDGDLNAAASEAQVGAWGDLVITADRLGLAEDFRVMGRGGAGAWSTRPRSRAASSRSTAPPCSRRGWRAACAAC